MSKKEIVSVILSVCLLTLFVMGNSQPATAYQNPLLEVNVAGIYLTAGGENGLSISIENAGESNAYDVKAALSVPSTVSDISIVNGSYAVFEQIVYYTVDAMVWMYPVLYVESNCPLGAYSLTLDLEYTDTSDNAYSDSVQIGVVVDAVEPVNPLLEIDTSGYKLVAGDENEMSIMITNIGESNAYDVKAALSVPSTVSEISIVTESYMTFDVIHHTENVWMYPVLYVESNCPLGAYSLTLDLEYTDTSDNAYSDSVQIGVAVDDVKPMERTKIAVQSFDVTPDKVFPGDEFAMEVELRNWGLGAYDVQVQLTIDPQGPFVSLDPTLVFAGDLGLNQTVDVIYNLAIGGDAEAQLHRLSFVISYYDMDDQPESLTEDISIRVHSIVDFRLLDVQPSSIKAGPGETVTIEADLLLLGTETVDFVEVGIVENRSTTPFVAVPESYEYIGRVDPDSPVLFTIQFMVDPDATSGSYTLQMTVDCWDGYNQPRQVSIEQSVVVSESSNPNGETNPTPWEIVWAIIRALFGVKP